MTVGHRSAARGTGRVAAVSLLAALVLFPLYPKIGLAPVAGTYIPVRLDDLITAVVAAVWSLSLVRDRRWPSIPTSVGALAAVWVACGLIAVVIGSFVLQTVSFTTALAFWAKPIEYLLLGLIAFDLVRTGAVAPKVLLSTVFAAAAVVVGYGLLERYALVPRFPGDSPIPGVVTSTVGDPHELASYLGVIVVVGAALWHRSSPRGRPAVLAALAAAGIVMFMTGARSEYVAAVLALLGLAAWAPVRRGAILAAAALLVTLVAVPLVEEPLQRMLRPSSVPGSAAGSPLPTKDVAERFGDDSIRSSLEVRFFVKWPRFIEAAMQDPVFGIGPSAATEAADGYYVRSFVEVGIVGTAAFLALIGSVAWNAWRFRRDADGLRQGLAYGLLAATAFLAIVGILIDTWVASRVMELYWPLVGATLAGLPVRAWTWRHQRLAAVDASATT